VNWQCFLIKNNENGETVLKNSDSLRPTVEKCASLLQALVRQNTCQPAGNEELLVELIERMVPNATENTRLDHGGGRSSLIMKIPGKTDTGGVAFIGHSDTVACGDPEKWQFPPLNAKIIEGVLYGRGAVDMKGGLASMLLTAEYLLEHKISLKKPVYFCFTADEENDGMGASAIAKGGYLHSVEEMFICEPSNEQICICEKGALWLRLTVDGVSAHSSRPETGVNSLEKAIEFERLLRSQINMQQIHSFLGTTTISVTRFNGGIMTNVIPEQAQIELDIRTIPGISNSDLLATAREVCTKMQTEQPRLKLTLEVLNNRPALEILEKTPFIGRVRQTASSLGMNPKTKGIYFYTDASQLIPALHIPFIILGPGDDQKSHQINEAIHLDSVARIAELYTSYLIRYLT
jgi:succinyl-diaminopimelate desuccinylase